MSSLTRSPSGKWWVRWRDPHGRQRTKTFEKQVHAKAFKAKLENSLLEGTYIDPSAGHVTVKEYAEEWRAAQPHRESTAAQIEMSFRVHVYPTIGNKRIGRVRTTDLQLWAKGLEGQLAASTIDTIAKHLAAVFNAAKRDRIIPFSPTEGWKRTKPEAKHLDPPTPAEIAKVASEIQPRYRAIVLAMAASGMRPGEACGLTVDALDRDGPSIRVVRQVITIDNKPKFGKPKTKTSTRTIPVPIELIGELDAHVEEFGLGPDGAIFTNTRGELVARHVFGDAWRKAARRAGVDATPHGCRHSYASVLIEAGESVKVIQSRLGHKSAKLTLDVYGHLWPSSDGKTRDAISDAFGDLMCSERVASTVDTSAQPW